MSSTAVADAVERTIVALTKVASKIKPIDSIALVQRLAESALVCLPNVPSAETAAVQAILGLSKPDLLVSFGCF